MLDWKKASANDCYVGGNFGISVRRASGDRFTAKDPIGFNGGLNFYAYTVNDPINFVDPSGLLRSGRNARNYHKTPGSCGDTWASWFDKAFDFFSKYGQFSFTATGGNGRFGASAQVTYDVNTGGVSGYFGIGHGIGFGASFTGGFASGGPIGWGTQVTAAGGSGGLGGAVSFGAGSNDVSTSAGIGWGVQGGVSSTIGYGGHIYTP